MEKFPKKILVIDDDPDIRLTISNLLKKSGYQAYQAKNCQIATEKIIQKSPDLILLDVKLSEKSGINFLKERKRLISNIPVIILTGYPKIRDAVESIKLGAYNYITKPFDNKELISIIRQSLQRNFINRIYKRYRLANKDRQELYRMMGNSVEIKGVVEHIERVAKTDFFILIEGESGVGKELVSRYIHLYSNRSSKPWVPVNCGAIPETLFESEFFGHIKGAYTGADRNKKGYFEEANYGTLFLDEISNLTISMQVKLLRTLQEQKIYRLGDTKLIGVNVRIIAASSEPLINKINKEEFSRALYYRINQFKIIVPPLRNRKNDIVYLASRFTREVCKELGKKVKGFSVEAENLLKSYYWPGNVRELKNVIRRTVLMTDSKITYQTLKKELEQLEKRSEPTNSIDHLIKKDLTWKELKKIQTKKYEKWLIIKVLRKTKGNISEAARQLQMDYKTLYNKIKQLDINKDDYKKTN